MTAIILVFIGGVLSSASPCVLATIPLVVGFAGGYAEGSRMKAFRFSLAFIIGLSTTFTAFGAAAALLGTMFGTTGWWWNIAVGVVALAMGLHMLGLYELRLPTTHSLRPKRGGLFGALLLGLFFGVASSPCATPVLVIILTFAATQQNILYGTLLLFVYAIGHTLLMLAAGTFSGFVEAFAASRGVANISLWARRISGAIIAVAGIWFISKIF